ncbi:hypothetical protein HNR42_000516 [Deinobacterium chartae]|uniref:Sensory transduction regulator n=1 Tax=Deinobacterium chartae TaxID=521158 RepID=A0A841HYX1_9DEIO|nr:hypothetical protein [Deinobacterium chartae]MBB6097102.1 hypothetical protein [Deinobacterium chartae]
MNAPTHAERYAEHLEALGYQPRVDSDGDVVFEVEGGHYLLLIDAADPDYFNLVYPNFWRLEDAAERRCALRAASRTCAHVKVAKVYLSRRGDDVNAATEMYLSSPVDFPQVFERALSAVRAAVYHFARVMRELEAAGDASQVRP